MGSGGDLEDLSILESRTDKTLWTPSKLTHWILGLNKEKDLFKKLKISLLAKVFMGQDLIYS